VTDATGTSSSLIWSRCSALEDRDQRGAATDQGGDDRDGCLQVCAFEAHEPLLDPMYGPEESSQQPHPGEVPATLPCTGQATADLENVGGDDARRGNQ
jgi:hypothetical protein